MYIANLRVTHQNAQHDVIDRLALGEEEMAGFMKDFIALENVSEVLVLQTCNRFEIYYTGKDEKDGRHVARKFLLDKYGASIANHIVSDSYLDTLNHLFRVVSSVDSMIVGENQIQAQVKDALEFASSRKYTGRVLEPLFQKALSMGKRIRTETRISKGKVSIASAAVDLANRHNQIENKRVTLVGTGNMASILAEYLPKYRPTGLTVVGRTPERINDFSNRYSCKPASISDLPAIIPETDILFSATSCPKVLITRETVEKATGGRSDKLTLIDIAMPSDIDPSVSELDGIQYFSIDDLREASSDNVTKRQEEVKKAEVIISEELTRLKMKLENLHTEHFLSRLNIYTEEIRNKELEKAYNKLETDDPNVKEVIDGLSRSLMKKILHNLLKEVKDNPATSEELERFFGVFTGNNNGTKMTGGGHPTHIPIPDRSSEDHPTEKTEKKNVSEHPHAKTEE
jgi:glutamyl-tRNA reductase